MLLADFKIYASRSELSRTAIDTTFFNKADKNTWVNLEDTILSLPHRSRKDFSFANKLDNDAREFVIGKADGRGGLEPIFSEHKPQIPFAGLPVSQKVTKTGCKSNGLAGGLCGIVYRSDISLTEDLSRKNKRFASLFHASSLENYASLVVALREKGFTPGQNLWGFPYDWRESVRKAETMKRLDELLENISNNGKTKVVIVAHSLGNFITKAYLASYPNHFKKFVSDWVSIAPPLQGVGGDGLSGLINGEHTGFSMFCNGTSSALGAQSYSFYELLPTKWLEKNLPFQVVIKSPKGSKIITTTDALTDFLLEGRKDAKLTFKGKEISLPADREVIAWAKKTRDILENTRLPSEVNFHLLYNPLSKTRYSHIYKTKKKNWGPSDITCANTPNKQNYCRDMPLCVKSEASYTLGDGTVPAMSALHPFGDAKNNPKHFGVTKVPGVTHQNLTNDETTVIPYILKVVGER